MEKRIGIDENTGIPGYVDEARGPSFYTTIFNISDLQRLLRRVLLEDLGAPKMSPALSHFWPRRTLNL